MKGFVSFEKKLKIIALTEYWLEIIVKKNNKNRRN